MDKLLSRCQPHPQGGGRWDGQEGVECVDAQAQKRVVAKKPTTNGRGKGREWST